MPCIAKQMYNCYKKILNLIIKLKNYFAVVYWYFNTEKKIAFNKRVYIFYKYRFLSHSVLPGKLTVRAHALIYSWANFRIKYHI